MVKILKTITILTILVLAASWAAAEPYFTTETYWWQNPVALTLRGTASWYSQQDAGVLKTTANMEIFDDQQLTCAMWGVPFNTLVEVTNLTNGKSVTVRVNDHGPAKRLVGKGRIIDLTKAAFSKIANPHEGLIPIQVSVLTP